MGMKAIGAGLAVGLTGVGTGVAEMGIGAAAVGAIAENKDFFGLGLLFTVIPETIASSVSSSVSSCCSKGEDNGTGSSRRRDQGKRQERSGPDTAGVETGSQSCSHSRQQACRGDQALPQKRKLRNRQHIL